MRYLLDTNVCIAEINGTPLPVAERFRAKVREGAEVYVSSVSLFELWYGVEKSARRDFNELRLEIFLAGAVRLLQFSSEDSAQAGRVRAILDVQGTPIGPYDLLIAGQALARGLVLVTHNVREFGRVAGLRVEDWQG